MNLEQIQQAVINYWWTEHRTATSLLTPEQIQQESRASARIAMREMESLEEIGLDAATAWSEAKAIVLVAPPTPEEMEQAKETLRQELAEAPGPMPPAR